MEYLTALKPYYMMREFPSASDFKDQPFLFCTRLIEDDEVEVRSYYEENKLTDGVICAVNEPIFTTPWTFKTLYINVRSDIDLTGLVAGYVSSHGLVKPSYFT